MASSAPVGSFSLGAASSYSHPRVHLRLPAAVRTAPRPLLSLRLPARPRAQRCASHSKGESAYNKADFGLPPWGPSVEEIVEFANTDFSRGAIRKRFARESKEAAAAVKGAIADVFRPLRENFNDMRSFEYVLRDTEEFHIGMPFGALMTCIGLYQLWKFAPSMCLDVALSYAFYKLSVLAADVRRRGFSPDLIIRLKLAIAILMFLKDIRKKIIPLDYIRVPVFYIYTLSVAWDLSGYKKIGKYSLSILLNDIKNMFGCGVAFPDPAFDDAYDCLGEAPRLKEDSLFFTN